MGGERDFGYWGEVLTTAAEVRGIAGLVIDACVRDCDALAAHGFPVFSTGLALTGASKMKPGAVDRPVTVGDVAVEPGDWVVGDVDGVVVLPGPELESVLTAGRARMAKEAALFATWRAGGSTVEEFGLDTTLVEGSYASVMGVVDRARTGNGHREAEAVDRRVVGHGSQAVHRVGRDVHEVALRDLARLVVDRHQASTGGHVVELVRGVRVRVDVAAPRHLELAHQLEVSPGRDLLHLSRRHEPPDGYRPVVLDDRRDLFDRANVHAVQRRGTP